MSENLTEREAQCVAEYLQSQVKRGGSAFTALAKDVGVFPSVLGYAYSGELISCETLQKILKHFDMTTEELFGVDIPYFECDLSNINSQIKLARVERELTVKEIAEELGMLEYSFANYETGSATPSRFTLEDIADVLEMTDRQLLTLPLIDEELIHRYIKAIRAGLGLNKKDFAKFMGFSSASLITRWEEGRHAPRLDTLKQIVSEVDLTLCELAEISIEELKQHCGGITVLMTAEERLEWLMKRYGVEEVGYRPDRDFKEANMYGYDWR